MLREGGGQRATPACWATSPKEEWKLGASYLLTKWAALFITLLWLWKVFTAQGGGAPGWLSGLSVWVLTSAQVVISQSWAWAPCWEASPERISLRFSLSPFFLSLPHSLSLSLSLKKQQTHKKTFKGQEKGRGEDEDLLKVLKSIGGEIGGKTHWWLGQRGTPGTRALNIKKL